MRRTSSLVKVAIVMMAKPNQRFWGYYLSRESEVRSGVLYPLLNRMLADGWLSSGWEDPADAIGRPPRRYYELTEDGRRELGAVLQRAQNERRFAGLNWGYAG